ncbi:MAG: carbohydrate ABC transporter permease [Candidatus Hadarchaeales archaeon]
MKTEFEKEWHGKKILKYAVLVIFAAIILVPIIMLVVESLKTGEEFVKNPLSLPSNPQFSNYIDAWRGETTTMVPGQKINLGIGIEDGFINSLIVVIASVFIILGIGPLAAYALSSLDLRGRRAYFYVFMSGMFIGGPALPALWMLTNMLGIYNTYLALILPYVAGALPFTILIMWSYFKSTSRSLYEAAKIDGLSQFKTYYKVMLPTAMPALMTVAILQTIWIWNEFLLSLVLIQNPNFYTIPRAVYFFSTAATKGPGWGIFFAGVLLAALPTVIAYLLFSEQIKRGMSMEVFKG